MSLLDAPRSGLWVGGEMRDVAPNARVRLFCFAHAGGGPAFFRGWRQELAPDIDVRPVLLPGRESRRREPPYLRMEQLLDPLCEALGPHLDRPYLLFGHSMGAAVAFEAARRLSGTAGRRPSGLLVSGRRAPGVPQRRRFTGLPDADFVAALAGLGGTPPEVLDHPELVNLLLPTLRADFELNESYRPLPGPGLDCPVAAYMGADDPEVDRAELLAWHQETAGEFTMRVFPGDHFYLKGRRPDVLSALRQDLDRLPTV
jgi:surfactin synthase thioesterase subunit